MKEFPVARYRYRFRMAAPLRLPAYAGSLLRGQFGASLRRIACMTGAPACEGCGLRASCPYPVIFEAPAPPAHAMQRFSHVPNAYVIEPALDGRRELHPGDMLDFNLVLMGHARAHLPLVTFALQRALSRGLGPQTSRANAELTELAWLAPETDGPVPLWAPGDEAIASHAASLPLPAPSPTREIDLEFVTPLRLQQQGRPLRAHELSPRKLIADLLRRVSLIAEFHAGLSAAVPDAVDLVRHAESLQDERTLNWQDWSRYSSRQKQEMTLGGVVGRWTLRGDLGPLLPWLWLGQWLHVGKNATMGLGRYTLHASARPA